MEALSVEIRPPPSISDREPVPQWIVLQTIAHDMRRHLTPIIGVSHTLLEHGSDLHEAERSEYVEIALRNALQLEHLIHEMIDVQRFDADGWILHRHLTDVQALIETLVPGLDTGSRSVTVKGDGSFVNVDPGLLERIIDNLIQNAKAYTPPGSPIIITTERDESGVLITVQDFGPGVPDQLKTSIFDDFHSGAAGGSGLGLSLVKRFSEVHGGRAWVEDGPGGGARFLVSLPEVGGAVTR